MSTSGSPRPAAVDADAHLPRPGVGEIQLDLVEHVDRFARALHLPRAHQRFLPSISAVALSSSTSTWLPKNSCTGLSDSPRWNLA